MLCTFKHTWTGNKFIKEIDPDIAICKLTDLLDDDISSSMNICDRKYVIIIAGQKFKEYATPINLSLDDKFSTLGAKTFYIRPT